MIVVMNKIPVAEGREEAFMERFRSRAGLVDGEPGFVRNMVLRPLKGDYHVVMTFWESLEAFQAWTRSEAFRKAHERVPPADMFKGRNELEVYDVGLSTEAAGR